MVRHIVVASMALVMTEVGQGTLVSAQSFTVQTKSTSNGDPQQLKETILERTVRRQPTYRGDNDVRLKWEWWDGVSRSYFFERNALIREVSTGHPSVLRPQRVLRNVKVSFQEIYRLGDGDDDKLVPILSYPSVLHSAPSSTFEGLTLYGKDGEVKGTIAKKYLLGFLNFGSALVYEDSKSGELGIAGGYSRDAFNLRWGHIKNRIADDISEEKAVAEAGYRMPVEPWSSTVQARSTGDPQQLKETILDRIVRKRPMYRGDNGARLKWEWWDGVSRSYFFEKNALVRAISTGHPSVLRPQWVLRNVKVSFQEIYGLDDGDDDKLVPILSHLSVVHSAPSSTFEGLTLYGKNGEAKGTISRKYTVSTKDYPSTYVSRMAASLERHEEESGDNVPGYFDFVSALEYKDSKNGKLEIARGNAADAVNLRWGDIKNRIADDLSEEKAAEDIKLLRDAYHKSLNETVPDR